MGGLFSKPKIPDPQPPATMPDPEDEIARRNRRRQVSNTAGQSSSAQTRLSSVPGTLGGEYTRQTLGAK